MTARTVALRTALAAYPAHYRRDRGAELAEVFADTTADAGRSPPPAKHSTSPPTACGCAPA
ncbi:hypothetical protein ACFQ1I_46045 [Kitasatospora arboriphila]